MTRFTRNFALLQGFYWIGASFVYAFAERFLTAYGCTVAQVGLVMAAANGAALLLQPLFAALADRSNGPSLRQEILALGGAGIAFAALLLVPGRPLLVTAVLFGALSTTSLTVQPMLNATGFHYIDRGESLDYSLGRGIASAAFAAYCLLAGYLAEWNADALTAGYLLANVGMLLVALVFAPKKSAAVPAAKPAVRGAELLRRYGYLVPFLIGTVLTFSAHNFINAYMLSIVETIGCGTREMSAAISLAAAVEIPTMMGFSLLQKRFRLRSMLRFSFCAFLLKHLLMLLPLYLGAGVWSVYLSQAVQLCGYALFIPASSYFVNERMRGDDKVKGQMLLTEAITVGCIIGQFVGGFGITLIGVAATMLVGCGLSGVGLWLLCLALKKSEGGAVQ